MLDAWIQEVQKLIELQRHTAHEQHACIGRIQVSTHVALANLQAHTETIKQAVKTLEGIASREFGSMESLLKRYERDLMVLSRIPVEPRLLVKTTAMQSQQPRTLGDYVNAEETRDIAQRCGVEFSRLRERHADSLQIEFQLAVDLADLTTEVNHTHYAPSTETLAQIQYACASCLEHLREIEEQCRLEHDRKGPVVKNCTAEHIRALNEKAERVHTLQRQISQCLACLVSDRNELVYRHLNLVQDISSLQSDYADFGAMLTDIDAELTSPKLDGFKHLNRIKKMVWAYGASLIEAVRRSEFTPLFMKKAQHVAELMAQFTESERTAREEHAVQVASQLPWEPAIGTQPPSLDVSIRRRDSEDTSSLSREDLRVFFQQLDALEAELLKIDPQKSCNPVNEIRSELQGLVAHLDRAEDTFTSIAQREFQLRDDDSDDGSEDQARSVSGSERIEDALRHQLALAQQRSERLEEELKRRTAEWSEERQALQRAASLAQSQLEANVNEQHAARSKAPEQLAQISERLNKLSMDDTNTVQQACDDLSRIQKRLQSEDQDWASIPPLLARVKALQTYACAADALNPPKPFLEEMSSPEARAALRTLDPEQFYSDVHDRLEYLASVVRRLQKCRNRSEKNNAAVTAAAAATTSGVQLSVADFVPGSLALFTPSNGVWAAFQFGEPRFYLHITDRLAQTIKEREWLVARIVRIEAREAHHEDSIPLAPGTAYSLVDVEGWDDPQMLLKTTHVPDRASLGVDGSEPSPSRKSSGGSHGSGVAAPWQPRANAPQRSLTVDGNARTMSTPRAPAAATDVLTRLPGQPR